jgi:ketosteroid isomerase-like protein
MFRTTSEIADALRAASTSTDGAASVLAGLYAEKVELRHVPGLPTDGPVDGALLGEMGRREVAASGRALVRTGDPATQITVEGDDIRMRNRTQGRLEDGTVVDVETNTLLRVSDGRIVELVSEMDDASMQAWGQVLVAGGIEVPEGFLEAPDADGGA